MNKRGLFGTVLVLVFILCAGIVLYFVVNDVRNKINFCEENNLSYNGFINFNNRCYKVTGNTVEKFRVIKLNDRYILIKEELR